MRIFIENANHTKINELFQCSQQFVNIYSIEGIFNITKQHIFKLKFIDGSLEKIDNYSGSKLSVIIDKSEIVHEIVYQIPREHTSLLIKKNTYGLNENSPIKYIVEEIYDVDDYLKNKPNDNNIDYDNTHECYIEIQNNTNLEDFSIKMELNKLLSYFN
jgi:hypothetical protein